MSCDRYRKYEMGRLKESAFKKHAQNCQFCREMLAWNLKLMRESRSLVYEKRSSNLWSSTENRLKTGNVPEPHAKSRAFSWPPHSVWNLRPRLRLAAAFLLVAFVGVLVFWRPWVPQSGLLAERALAKIEKKEAAYLESIEDLERLALPRMEDLDLEMMLLFRERLEIIDEQIVDCREALAENRANAHIRRYLMAALQEKKQTLKELLEMEITS